jgi:hypothetical protein
MERNVFNEVLNNVKENRRKLDSCNYHEFEDMTSDKLIGKKYKCKNCQGEVDGLSFYWYNLGRKQINKKIMEEIIDKLLENYCVDCNSYDFDNDCENECEYHEIINIISKF